VVAQPLLGGGAGKGGAGPGADDGLGEVVVMAAPVDDGCTAHPGHAADLGEVPPLPSLPE
jgi:hypothetical protein